MKEKTKYIIGGLIAIGISLLFAKLSVDSPIEMWYDMMSVAFGFGGLMTVIISIIEF